MNPLLRCAPFAVIPMLVNCGSMHNPPAVTLSTAQQRLRVSPQPAVLFVGNSFSHGVPAEFQRIAAQHGTAIRTKGVTHDGWTLSRHVKSSTTREAICSGVWDVVVLQEQSQIPARSSWMRRVKMRPSLHLLADEIRATGAIPVLMQTWGYRNGDNKRSGDNFHRMTECVRKGIHEEAALAKLPVIPVGDAWQQTFHQNGADALFHPDGKHPGKAGNRTTARTVYEALFPHLDHERKGLAPQIGTPSARRNRASAALGILPARSRQ